MHAILITHTPRHIRRTLMGVVHQLRRPDSITVSLDGDSPELVSLIHACAAEFNVPIRLVTRPHQGVCRSAQVRNNGARAAIEAGAAPDDLLIFFDGDCCPAPESLKNYEALFATPGSSPVSLVLGHWCTLTPEQTQAFDEAALAAGRWPVTPSPRELQKLPARQRRYHRQMFFRKLGLGKSHKPKLASGNFGVRVSAFTAVNGFDELYEGYGQEDDDLGRRLYKSGARAVMGVDRCLVFHQWHPTRQPGPWETAPGVQRFNQPYAIHAERGLSNPAHQPVPLVTLCHSTPSPLASHV